MPDRCCVPGCRSNYDGENEKVSVFKFPNDEERKQLWLNKIPRTDFVPGKRSVVCSKHFSEQFIIKVDSVIRDDGSVLSVERKNPKLTKVAYPSKFPNCPSYLSSEPLAKRKKPEDRRAEAIRKDEESFLDWMKSDEIKTYSAFTKSYAEHTDQKWIHEICRSTHGTELDYVSFYFISDVPNDNSRMPTLHSTIRIYSTLHVEVSTANGARVPNHKLKWIFGPHSPSTLVRWSQFDCLLSHFSSQRKGETIKEQIQSQIENLYEICLILCDSSYHNEDDEENSFNKKLLFLVDQLKLCFSQQKRYQCETLLCAFQVYALSPSTYSFIKSNLLTLPSISYLRRLSSVFKISGGVSSENSHESYLHQKCINLRAEERSIILMLDEIHVAHNVSYTGGGMEGMALNCSSAEASTAQVFMISSYFSKNKDVAAIVPVKNINAKTLHDLTKNCFTSMCGETLVPWIQHPFNPSEKLFFLFDSVHLFKCIRNHWLTQKDLEKTFIYPSFTLHNDTKKAAFYFLRKLYNTEKSAVVKLAPALNCKSVYPTNTERQNVKLMLKVFDLRNSLALSHYKKRLESRYQWH